MRFAAFKINLKKTGAVFFCAMLCAAALSAAANTWMHAALPAPDNYDNFLLSSSSSSVDSSHQQIDNPDYLGDVGGEYASESDIYNGELSVPAHISLERIDINAFFCKPLDNARVSSLFGYRQNPVSGKYSFHSGYDLAAPHGSNIYAMYSGTVTTASYDNGYGNYVIIEHDGGFQTLYAHCSKLLCSKGDSVNSGDIIALVGSTGNSTGAHLHVEFRKNGQRYDPEWILGGIY